MVCWLGEHGLNIKLTLYLTTDSEMLIDRRGIGMKGRGNSLL